MKQTVQANPAPNLFREMARVVDVTTGPGHQYLLRLLAPQCVAHAQPGQFVQLRCHDRLPLPRPFSIFSADDQTGCIEILYKVVGVGTALLSRVRKGDELALLGPIGRGFSFPASGQQTLLLGGGVGIPPVVFLALELRKRGFNPVVFLGSEIGWTFRPYPSRILTPSLPSHVVACMPVLEEAGIVSRLCSFQARPGCFEGWVTDLASHYVRGLDSSREVLWYACGPDGMLKAAALLAARAEQTIELCVEEHMACGWGGCAGCCVKIRDRHGAETMRRVCVDGPVFFGHEMLFSTEPTP